MSKLIAALKFLFRKRLTISSSIIDAAIKDFHYKITPENVLNYNQVVSEDSQLPNFIHPVYFTKISWQVLEKLEQFLKSDIDIQILKTMVHQSEQIIFHKPITTDANLIMKSQIWSVSPHKKGTKMVVRFDYYCDKDCVVTEYSAGILFGVKCEGEAKFKGEQPQTERVENDALWEASIPIERELPYTYASKAEIDAPIHTDEEFAKSIGLPDIILQGTCSFAKAISLLLTTDPSFANMEVRSVSAKFTGMVVPPNTLTVKLLHKESNAVFFDVMNKNNEAVIKGGSLIFRGS